MSEFLGGRRPRVIGMATAAVICLVYLVLRPPSEDFASGHFRAGLAARGAYVWNNLWFGGHPLPGYGIVSPLVGATVGVVPLAVVSVLVATFCFVLLVERWVENGKLSVDPTVGVVLFACGCGVNLWGGRLTFGPAIMLGTAALLAVQRDRRVLAVLAAAACGLSSPLGALSLVVVLTALWFAGEARRSTLVITAVGAVVPIGVLIAAFPESGWFPFTGGSLLLLLLSLAVIGWCGWRMPVVRYLVLVYGVVAIASFLVRSPLGGNVVRLGWLVAGPIAALTLRSRRKLLVPVIVAAALVWNGSYIAMAFSPADRSADAGYYESLADFLDTSTHVQRVEVVPTETFGQADVLALRTNGIARGWETQLDRELNPELYTGELDAATYQRWLHANSVSLVALPLGAVRPTSQDEVAVIRSHPAYLRLVWSNADWQTYEVVDATPLADRGATVVDVEPESLVIDAPRSGWTTVKYRYTDLYQVESGAACINASPDGWIQMLVRSPGRITLAIDVTAGALLQDPTTCT